MFVFFTLVKYYCDEPPDLDLRLSDMKYSGSTNFMDVFAMQYDLRTVGELYDFIYKHGLSSLANIL